MKYDAKKLADALAERGVPITSLVATLCQVTAAYAQLTDALAEEVERLRRETGREGLVAAPVMFAGLRTNSRLRELGLNAEWEKL